jgi:di/tricarboxylate transporter
MAAVRDAAAAFGRASGKHGELAVVVPKLPELTGEAAAPAVVEGLLLSRYRYDILRREPAVLVAGMIPVSTAMQVSGAAGEVAERLVDIVGDGGSSLLLFGIFVIGVVLGAMISNTATALIVIPIALSAGAELGVSPKPLLLAVSVSCAEALITPVSTASNLMVMEPGAYKFGDYAKFGLPILAVYGVLVVFYIPLIWSL